MSTFARKEINFVELENELQSAIDADARYWKENDAKFRAVNQKVQTYDEFRNIVKAAHLKPLEKKDHLNVLSKGCIWNTVANKTNPQFGSQCLSNHNDASEDIPVNNFATLVLGPIWEFPASGIQFLETWKRLNPCQHLNYLEFVVNGPTEIISSVEIPAEIFQQIINALSLSSTSSNETANVKLLVDTLKSVTKSKRFTLMKDFLNQEDKNNCTQLIEKQIKLIESSRDIGDEMLPLKQELKLLQKTICDSSY